MIKLLTDKSIVPKFGSFAAFAKFRAALNAQTDDLVTLAKRRDAVADKLAESQKHLESLVAERSSLYTAIAEKVRAAFELVPAQGVRSVNSLLASMSKALTTAAAFTRDFAKLKARGLSETLLDQLAEAGRSPVRGWPRSSPLPTAPRSPL